LGPKPAWAVLERDLVRTVPRPGIMQLEHDPENWASVFPKIVLKQNAGARS
jgi:hypothetical protein